MHKSFQRAVTIHETEFSTVTDNAAFDILGHVYFFEDGTENWNVCDRNLIIKTNPMPLGTSDDLAPAGFWVAIPIETTWNQGSRAQRFCQAWQCFSQVFNKLYSSQSFGNGQGNLAIPDEIRDSLGEKQLISIECLNSIFKIRSHIGSSEKAQEMSVDDEQVDDF